MKSESAALSLYCRYVKRALDIFFSIILIIFLSPVMLIIGAAVRIDSSGKAIFKQRRMGRGARAFTCYKFRTMRCDAPSDMSAQSFLNSQKYVTRVGRFLRRSSLDELPQLFNVLKGDMSLVGPRPLICSENELHRMRSEAGIYAIRPGLTGLAQIKGRNLLCDSEKLANDKEYLDNLKIRLDAKIIFLTLGCVLGGKGVSCENIKK